ncbi:hypothetical protein JCM11251_007611 [Rhodosporidiobolus azoricus]
MVHRKVYHDSTGDLPKYGGPDAPRPSQTPFDQMNSLEDSYRTMDALDYFEAPYTLQEADMQALSYAIRCKPDWWKKYRDPSIRAKWVSEVREQPARYVGGTAGPESERIERPRLTANMVKYVFDELEWHEKQLIEPNGIRASCFDKVLETDSLIPPSLRDSLIADVAKLEKNPPLGVPDWHPGSNEQVLDLLHPSLWPLRYKSTPVRVVDAEGKVTEQVSRAPPPRNALHSTSEEFQWLPSDFDVDVAGRVSISSYINNLHPDEHASLYPIISSLFERFLSLFERVLSDLQKPPPHRILFDWKTTHEWWHGLYEDEPHNPDEDSGFYDDYDYGLERVKRVLVLPEPKEFKQPEDETGGLAFPLKGKKLQVITKIASIHLTPDKPDYEGGSWHVEGMQNEEIVASGIYYFSQENITESQLAFRGTFDDDLLPYEQCDYRGIRAVFGVEDEGPCVQDFGALSTAEGRCICFPNIYQHRVSPFSLADKTRPGYRKILVFFLVDPLKSASGAVISTSRVPYQQRDWVARELARAVKESAEESAVRKVPVEIWDKVLNEMDWLMDYEKAKKVRKKLMRERKFLVDENTKAIFERQFALCEH